MVKKTLCSRRSPFISTLLKFPFSVFIFFGPSTTLHMHYQSLLTSRTVTSLAAHCQPPSLLFPCLTIGVAQEPVLFDLLFFIHTHCPMEPVQSHGFKCHLYFDTSSFISSPDLSPEVQTPIACSASPLGCPVDISKLLFRKLNCYSSETCSIHIFSHLIF